MKRHPSMPIPEWSAAPGRKRSLSEEERALWESVVKQTKPLRKKPRAAKAPAASSDEMPVAAKPATALKPHPSVKISHPPKSKQPSAPPLAPIGRRERAQLSRGKKEI